MLKNKLQTFLFLSGVIGCFIALILAFNFNNTDDIKDLKAQQFQSSIIVKDLVNKEIGAVFEKCQKVSGNGIKWRGQFSLVEKYCNDERFNSDINNISKCKMILSKCKHSE